MAKQAIKDWTLLVAGSVSGTPQVEDLSGYANNGFLEETGEERDTVTWGDTFHQPAQGRPRTSFRLQSFIDDAAAQPFENIRGLKGITASAVAGITSNASMAEGDIAVFLPNCQEFSYGFPGDGIDALFTAEGMGEGVPLVYGFVLQQDESLAATGNSTGIQITGGVPAGSTLYAVEFMLSGTGTIDGKIQSDTTSGFSAPTDRITFSQKSGENYESKTVAGAITDTWFRYNYTIVTGPFTAVVLVGVAAS